jgi:glycerophosphoryl diester phosphodiesterase
MKVIGHRGARGLAPENTVASIVKALEHKVDEVECDVRVTRDNIPVLHHDAKLNDAAGNKLTIKHHFYNVLVEHKPDLPTLAEAIEAVGNQSPILIEVKPGVVTRPIINLVKKYPQNQLLLGSKSQKTLLELHKALPGVTKVVIEPWSGVRASRRAREIGTKRISMNQLWLWRGFISAFGRGDYELYAYTLNNPGKAKRWEKYGLTGIITDRPDLFKR